ncbi:MAG: MFS transporter, partial [Pseudomonadales bacterium]
MTAISLHGFLIAWIFVGILETSPGTYAWIRFFMELAPLAVLLIGGFWADRADARNLILFISLFAVVLPLLLIPMAGSITLQVAFLFGLGMALLQALSDPARQSIINRVTRFDIQRTVTVTTVITTLAGLVGVWIGGKLEAIGIRQILVIQATVIAASAFALSRLPALPPAIRAEESVDSSRGLARSFELFWGLPLIRNVIGLNFLSSLFNAGAYTIAVPYIVTQVYEGGADFFADTMIWFMAGSI